MSFILTHPAGSASEHVTSTGDLTVPSSATLIVDMCTCLTVKWIVTLYNQTENVTHAVEVVGLNRFDTNPEHNEYGHVGDDLNYDIDVDIQTGSMVLKITNNESYDFIANVTRIRTN